MSVSSKTVSSRGTFIALMLCAVIVVAFGPLGFSPFARAAAGDPFVLGMMNRSTPTTYLNWDKATYPSRDTGLAVRGDVTAAVFATSEEYLGSLSAEDRPITGLQAAGNDRGGYFYGVNAGLESESEDLGIRASGDTAIRADGGSVGLAVTGDTALEVDGAVSFSSAGLVRVPKGKQSVTVSTGADLSAESKVLATAQSPGGQVRGVRRAFGTGSLTIQLVSPATRTVIVAYFVIQ